MSDTVLVTGAGGFVGSAVVRRFVNSANGPTPRFADGAAVAHVVALLRPGSSTERLEELPRTGSWSIEYADLTDRPTLRGLLARIRPKAILHLAMVRSAHRDLSEDERHRVTIAPLETLFEGLSEDERHRVTIAPLETLFEGLAKVPGARFINTSSAWVLRAGDRLDENAPIELRSAYAETKALVERALPGLHRNTGVDWINLRLFNVFGPYESASQLLPYLVASLTSGQPAELSAGCQIRDFSCVETIADAYRAALQADRGAYGRVYHIGSGLGTTVRDFAMMVARTTGNAHLIRFGASQTSDQDLPCLVADPSRAQRVLHWVPSVDLGKRVRKTVEWWRERLGTVGTAASQRGPASPRSIRNRRPSGHDCMPGV